MASTPEPALIGKISLMGLPPWANAVIEAETAKAAARVIQADRRAVLRAGVVNIVVSVVLCYMSLGLAVVQVN
jgi:hypothetical protein